MKGVYQEYSSNITPIVGTKSLGKKTASVTPATNAFTQKLNIKIFGNKTENKTNRVVKMNRTNNAFNSSKRATKMSG